MRLFLIYLGFISCILSCNSQISTPKVKDMHAVVVLEVIQATDYTYLKLSEDDAEFWVAVQKMQAEKGETYYYKGGFVMNDFESKELGRTFKEIYFVDAISKEPLAEENSTPHNHMHQNEIVQNNLHEVVVKEVLQAVNYTYLRVLENEKEHWVALPKTEAKIGGTYFYEGGSLMVNFESKDLKRVFEEVFFIGGIREEKDIKEMPQSAASYNAESAKNNEIQEIKIEPAKDGISIAQLYSNLNKYANKTVKIKGQVTKYNSQIMGKNWIHIQDGTKHDENIDLTVTSNLETKVGDVVIVEGKITLKKDFGHGYFYEVIIEDAKVLK